MEHGRNTHETQQTTNSLDLLEVLNTKTSLPLAETLEGKNYKNFFSERADDESKRILDLICEELKIDYDFFFKTSHKPQHVHPRFLFMYLRRNHSTGITLKKIGRLFGMNHATVIHWINHIKNQIDVRRWILSRNTHATITDPTIQLLKKKRYVNFEKEDEKHN